MRGKCGVVFVVLAVAAASTDAVPTIPSTWYCDRETQLNEASRRSANVLNCEVETIVTLEGKDFPELCHASVIDTSLLVQELIPSLTSYTCPDGEESSVAVQGTRDEAYGLCFQKCLEEDSFQCRSVRIETELMDTAYRCVKMSCYVGQGSADMSEEERVILGERLPQAKLDTENTVDTTRSLWLNIPEHCYGQFPTHPPTAPLGMTEGQVPGFQIPIHGVALSEENVVYEELGVTAEYCGAKCVASGLEECVAFTYRTELGVEPLCSHYDELAAQYEIKDEHSTLFVRKELFVNSARDDVTGAYSDEEDTYGDISGDYESEDEDGNIDEEETSEILRSLNVTVKYETINTFMEFEPRGVSNNTFIMNGIVILVLGVASVYNSLHIAELMRHEKKRHSNLDPLQPKRRPTFSETPRVLQQIPALPQDLI